MLLRARGGRADRIKAVMVCVAEDDLWSLTEGHGHVLLKMRYVRNSSLSQNKNNENPYNKINHYGVSTRTHTL